MKAVVMASDEGAMLRPLTCTLPVGKLEGTGAEKGVVGFIATLGGAATGLGLGATLGGAGF